MPAWGSSRFTNGFFVPYRSLYSLSPVSMLSCPADGAFWPETADLLYRFADFVLDPDRRELRRGRRLVAMAPAVHLFAGRYDEASSWAEKGLREANWAGAARIAAASNALAGRLDQARKAVAPLRQIDPTFRISDVKKVLPFRRPEDIARYEEGLRTAGLQE